MNVAVLTSASGISEADQSRAIASIGTTGAAVRLSANAVEFPTRAALGPADFAGADLNVVPEEGRAKKILLADMDSTMIGVECIDELADFVGQKDHVASITERAMRGELDFNKALAERVAILKGVTEAQIEECYRERVHLNPGAADLIGAMNAAGAMTMLVSGGFTVFTGRVAEKAGFQRHRANVLTFEGDALAGTVSGPIVNSATKLATLRELTAEFGVSEADVVAIGDGANDGEMVKAAGLGVAYKAKPALRAVADACLDHSDLTAVLALQGRCPS